VDRDPLPRLLAGGHAHTRSFAALGGMARYGTHDDMKTDVDKVKKATADFSSVS
jgi:hypothetical protein